MKKIFTKEYLTEDLELPYSAIEDRITRTRRWNAFHEIVFQDKDGKYWSTGYSCRLTEMQDERPWEYEYEIECTLVEKRLVQVERWVPVEGDE